MPRFTRMHMNVVYAIAMGPPGFAVHDGLFAMVETHAAQMETLEIRKWESMTCAAHVYVCCCLCVCCVSVNMDKYGRVAFTCVQVVVM